MLFAVKEQFDEDCEDFFVCVPVNWDDFRLHVLDDDAELNLNNNSCITDSYILFSFWSIMNFVYTLVNGSSYVLLTVSMKTGKIFGSTCGC